MYQKQSNLIFRLIIGAFLSCSFFVIYAQELDPVIIKNNTVNKGTTYKPITRKPNAPKASEVVPDDVPDEVVVSIEAAFNRPDETYRKEEYLNKLLRQTYYQKLTTNKWSKYLHPEGWKKNVEKWRYWSQLKQYVTSEQDLLVLRSTADEPKEKPLIALNINERSIDSKETINPIDTEEVVVAAPPIVTDDIKQPDEVEIIDTIINQSPQLVSVTVAPWLKDKPSINLQEIAVDKEVEDEVTTEEDQIEQQEIVLSQTKEEIVTEVIENPINNNSEKEERIAPVAIQEPQRVEPTVAVVEEPVLQKQAPTVTVQANKPRTTIVTSDPEDFGRLKGVLPWPVTGGRITDRFGIRKNAEARGLRPENYGIDMVCPSGATIKATHSGTVLMAKRQSPYDYIITIKHGDFTSAYYYLITPYVKPGDVVQSGQAIGQLRTSVAEADFHFEIWNNQDRVNPELWLQRR